MKVTSLLFTFTMIGLLQACSTGNGNDPIQQVDDAIPVSTIPLQKEAIDVEIQTSGLFTTDDETNLSFKTGGIIEKIYVKEGDAVKKNQVLATLNLTEIAAQVKQAKLGFEKANRDYTRAENLYKDSVATLEQFQNAKTAMQVAQQQVEAAEFNLSYSQIRANKDGFVLRKMANEGQVISAGTTVLQINGAANKLWKMKVGVSDREWSRISIGDEALLQSDAFPEKVMKAIVSRKSEGSDVMNGTFNIDLSLTESNDQLASGLFGTAIIKTSKKQEGWRIPYAALLDGNAKHGYVFTSNDLKTVERVNVVVGSIERNEVIVISGLAEKKHLIVSGSAYLKDGSSIRANQ